VSSYLAYNIPGVGPEIGRISGCLFPSNGGILHLHQCVWLRLRFGGLLRRGTRDDHRLRAGFHRSAPPLQTSSCRLDVEEREVASARGSYRQRSPFGMLCSCTNVCSLVARLGGQRPASNHTYPNVAIPSIRLFTGIVRRA
jgi:hypothetical protein